MVLNEKGVDNQVAMRFDARNKESKYFNFDMVAQGEIKQRDFFEKVGVKRMVRQVVHGYHSTIFAYGQTGAGKTYTMEGYKYQMNENGKYEPQIEQSVASDNLGVV
jgi:predicted ATPase